MTVTGIFEKPVDNTQINFDMVRLIGDVDSRCYVRITENTDPKELENILEKKTIGCKYRDFRSEILPGTSAEGIFRYFTRIGC
jgi:hypothetical protein